MANIAGRGHHGGFAQAAEALHRSQSSVSYTVARMQDQLGVPLLRIDGRKAVPPRPAASCCAARDNW